jgi:hypothetical protein
VWSWTHARNSSDFYVGSGDDDADKTGIFAAEISIGKFCGPIRFVLLHL